MQTGLVLAAALLADALLGEPRRWHPLVGFGRVAARLEAAWNVAGRPENVRRLSGVVALILLVVPPTLAIAGLGLLPHGWAIDVLVLYLAIGLNSLGGHGRAVGQALERRDPDAARRAVGMMVSRDSGTMNERQVSAAATESVLENGSDAVFGAIFWFLLAGAAGAAAYRLVNTLDAMWGYRTERLAAFGWAAARLDDVLNWIPARLTVLTYALVSAVPLRALICARRQGGRTESPNAGRVMAAGAGALGVRLGGPAVYHGRAHRRPRFGLGALPRAVDIRRAVRLVRHGAILWVLAVLLVESSLA
ncbi:MAG: adenosylcobinamide-phosphate synthase CbiB [Halofilum sp. (in: g-proteobacteria)]|nr:adenosylcobinamide-phosphate synthase CbiB [Halofilum sp. (in: g-proteobacteria)]